LVDQPNSTRLRLKPLVNQSLRDWALGAVDASGLGLGGFYFSTPSHSTYYADQPIIFRAPFPTSIQQRLVTHTNPAGDVTNGDLELAALVLGAAVLRTIFPQSHASLICASNNIVVVNWATGSPVVMVGQSHSPTIIHFATRIYPQLH